MTENKDTYWKIGLQNYKKFIKEKGHPFVPIRQAGTTSKDDKKGFKAFTYGSGLNGEPFLLGRWVAYARKVWDGHVKNPTPLSSRRCKELRKCGFMPKTDIRELLIGDIEDNAKKIDGFLKQVFLIISRKLNNVPNELSLERYFYKQMSNEIASYHEEIEVADEYGCAESIGEDLSNILMRYEEKIMQLERAQKDIKIIKREMRELLDN